MNSFAIVTPHTYEQAAELLEHKGFSLPMLKAGGMDVVDHLKEGLYEPDLLISIRRVGRSLNEPGIRLMEGDGSIQVSAATTMAELVASELIRASAPVISQALERAATPQVRTVATAAGNLLQRPRCWYYRNSQFPCLKKGGDACFAVAGENKYHAIFGDGPCHIVHPSNLAPALMVCDGVVHLHGKKRTQLPLADLYHMPAVNVRSEHTLEPGEIITHVTFSVRPASGFYAVKEKQSFDWPLAMCAASLELDGQTIRSAQIVAGAVAPVPWPLPKVAEALKGVSIADEEAIRSACAQAAAEARPMTGNAYKVKLLPVVVRRAVQRAAGHLPDDLLEL